MREDPVRAPVDLFDMARTEGEKDRVAPSSPDEESRPIVRFRERGAKRWEDVHERKRPFRHVLHLQDQARVVRPDVDQVPEEHLGAEVPVELVVVAGRYDERGPRAIAEEIAQFAEQDLGWCAVAVFEQPLDSAGSITEFKFPWPAREEGVAPTCG
jgi:hypothetical protein